MAGSIEFTHDERSSGDAVVLDIGGERSVTLGPDELRRLLDRLAALGSREAASIADEVAALRLAGGRIRLLPTEAELAALVTACQDEGDEDDPLPPALVRLRRACRAAGRGAR